MGMKIIKGGIIAGQKIKSNQGYLRALSKSLSCGTTYELFFRLVKSEEFGTEIVSANVPGRKAKFEVMGTGFIPCDVDIDEDTRKMTDVSGLQSLARIARAYFDAEFKREMKKIEQNAKEIAEENGEEVDLIAKTKKEEKLKLKYYGDKETNTYPKENPILQGLVLSVCTEVVAVPLNQKSEPEWNKLIHASLELSKERIDKLVELIQNPDYCNPEVDEYLEVSLPYGLNTNDKSEAGRNSKFQGVAKSISLAAKFPESWAANKDKISVLADTPETIVARNMSLSKDFTLKQVVEKFKEHFSKNSIVLKNLDLESDEVANIAKDLVDFDLVSSNKPVQEALLEIIRKQAEEKGDSDVVENDKEEIKNDLEVQGDIGALQQARGLVEISQAVENLGDLVQSDEEFVEEGDGDIAAI